MECNRDEADRAKQIAEKKFLDKDLSGSRKFALKAQQLFPGLEGISHMLSVLDVHIAAENKICGQPDWYGMLGITPFSDEETVRKQYRKLALVLHPDKNKVVGADAAFKLISEALSLLSDKNRRVAYDQMRNKRVERAPTVNRSSSTGKQDDVMHKTARPTPTSNPTAPRSNTQGTPTPTMPSTPRAPAAFEKMKSNSFWTLCRACMMQYEYFRIYLNHKIICPSCRQPFIAVEVPPPPSCMSNAATSLKFPNKQKNSNHHVSGENKTIPEKTNIANEHVGFGSFNSTDLYQQNSFQQHPFAKTSTTPASAQATNMVQQAHEKQKRAREEAQATVMGETLQKKQHIPTNPAVPNNH